MSSISRMSKKSRKSRKQGCQEHQTKQCNGMFAFLFSLYLSFYAYRYTAMSNAIPCNIWESIISFCQLYALTGSVSNEPCSTRGQYSDILDMGKFARKGAKRKLQKESFVFLSQGHQMKHFWILIIIIWYISIFLTILILSRNSPDILTVSTITYYSFIFYFCNMI